MQFAYALEPFFLIDGSNILFICSNAERCIGIIAIQFYSLSFHYCFSCYLNWWEGADFRNAYLIV